MLNYCANGPAGYTITKSLRFRASASAYLSQTFGVAGNRQIWTLSAWVKRGAFDSSNNTPILYARTGGTNALTDVGFDTNNCFRFFDRNSSSVTQASLVSTQVFRDPSAWYHIIVSVDTTQATAANRIKLYVNGSQVTSFSTATYPAQNTNLNVNSAISHFLASSGPTYGVYTDCYLAEVNFIDGQALTPSSFGSTNAITGVWQPIKYAGTYGTDGFYFNFTNTSSVAALGYDQSPNGNNWNVNNVSLTAGTTYDSMIDSPTNASSGTQPVGNYCTINPLYNSTSTISNANLQVATTVGTGGLVIGTIGGLTSGKYYWEATIISQTFNPSNTTAVGIVRTLYGRSSDYLETTNGDVYFGNTASNGDVYGVAADFDTGSLTVYKNNSSVSTQSFTSSYGWFPGFSDEHGNQTVTLGINFGQRPFAYTPPSGYKSLCTTNLPDSTIVQGNKYMDATLYTGTASNLTVTNAGAFQPDLVWIKVRSTTGDHGLIDSVRGNTKQLYSNSTTSEGTSSSTRDLTSFNSNGFSLGAPAQNFDNNANGSTYVGWQWQAGKGTTSSNTQGSITSTVSVSTTAGFSVVTWTGTGALATVGHGLGVAPSWIIFKNRTDVVNWNSYHSVLGATKAMQPNLTDAAVTTSSPFNNTSPTSSVFTVNTSNAVNGSGKSMVAYCFAEIAGFSKFTSYTGNGSADGVFVYLGFLPKYLMIKCSSSAGFNWYVWDSVRNTYNVLGEELEPNLSDAALTQTDLDITANGFKIRTTAGRVNQNGATYIVAAFASNPFKNSNAF